MELTPISPPPTPCSALQLKAQWYTAHLSHIENASRDWIGPLFMVLQITEKKTANQMFNCFLKNDGENCVVWKGSCILCLWYKEDGCCNVYYAVEWTMTDEQCVYYYRDGELLGHLLAVLLGNLPKTKGIQDFCLEKIVTWDFDKEIVHVQGVFF